MTRSKKFFTTTLKNFTGSRRNTLTMEGSVSCRGRPLCLPLIKRAATGVALTAERNKI
jgi:hypothetical protein